MVVCAPCHHLYGAGRRPSHALVEAVCIAASSPKVKHEQRFRMREGSAVTEGGIRCGPRG